ncbi:MAG: hypothetical protein E6Q97_36930 [Desulfurellales bacterium]|nr:MAG: hypothetical protein E6Q97_36930 [Desulfurellales bacterium]
MSSENLCDDICAEWCGRPTGQLVAALCGPSDRSPKGIASSFIESSIEILASPGEDFARLIVRDDVERMLVGWLAVDLTAHARSASPPPVRR